MDDFDSLFQTDSRPCRNPDTLRRSELRTLEKAAKSDVFPFTEEERRETCKIVFDVMTKAKSNRTRIAAARTIGALVSANIRNKHVDQGGGQSPTVNVNVAVMSGAATSIANRSTKEIVSIIAQGGIVDPEDLKKLPPQEQQSIYDAISRQQG